MACATGTIPAATDAAEALGWPAETIHVERFGAGPRKGDEPFEAVCQLSGKTVKVEATEGQKGMAVSDLGELVVTWDKVKGFIQVKFINKLDLSFGSPHQDMTETTFTARLPKDI